MSPTGSPEGERQSAQHEGGPAQPTGSPEGERRSAQHEGGPASAIVRVAAAVIRRSDGDVLLAQRPPGKDCAGYWEFPGGKLEAGETPAQALARELREELGIVVRRASPWLTREYVYPHAHVAIDFFRVVAWEGEPAGHDGQALAWQDPTAIDVAPLLPANARVLAALTLPPVYGISCAAELGEQAFLSRTAAALDGGLRLIQLREKEWDASRRAAFAVRLNALATVHGGRVLVNGDADEARQLGCAGVHWTSARLAAAASRPRDLMVGASCHTRADLERASALDVDFAVLGPLRSTPTHPQAAPLGWEAFERIVAGTRVPVYALGGLGRDDLVAAVAYGAHGIALRRAAWLPA
ncbi:MAG TPA: Nudix family hydrolase [Casimicrobiaceae bacterium]|nr:Nudix family hydrolase [Casimicrobiaceae bacterium]